MILNTVDRHRQIQPVAFDERSQLQTFSNTFITQEPTLDFNEPSQYQDILSDENIGIESLVVEFDKKCKVNNECDISVHDLQDCNLIRLSNGQEFLIPTQTLLERSVYVQQLMAKCDDKHSHCENINRAAIDIDLIYVFGSADEIPEEHELSFFFEILKNPSLLTHLLSTNEEPDLNHAFDLCFVSIELASYFQSDEVLKTADILLAEIISRCSPERGGYHQLLWYAKRHNLSETKSKCLDGVFRECFDDNESLMQVKSSLEKFLHLFL